MILNLLPKHFRGSNIPHTVTVKLKGFIRGKHFRGSNLLKNKCLINKCFDKHFRESNLPKPLSPLCHIKTLVHQKKKNPKKVYQTHPIAILHTVTVKLKHLLAQKVIIIRKESKGEHSLALS
jgi:hypothetical protein